MRSSIGIENRVRKITSAAMWLVSGSMSMSRPSASGSSRAEPDCAASHIAAKLSRSLPPSKAWSMMRRWCCQVAPFEMKLELPSSGCSPAAMRGDFGKSIGRCFRIRSISLGSLQVKLRMKGRGTRPSSRDKAGRIAPTGCHGGNRAGSARARACPAARRVLAGSCRGYPFTGQAMRPGEWVRPAKRSARLCGPAVMAK